jgi:hypothetical protein
MALAENYTSLAEILAKQGDRLVRLRTGADIIGRHPDTLKRLAKRGEIKLVKSSIRTYDVWLSELARWVKACEERTMTGPTADVSRAARRTARERLRSAREAAAT